MNHHPGSTPIRVYAYRALASARAASAAAELGGAAAPASSAVARRQSRTMLRNGALVRSSSPSSRCGDASSTAPRPQRPSSSEEAQSPEAQAPPTPDAEPEAENAESLGFVDLLDQLEDMAQPSDPHPDRPPVRCETGIALPDLAASGLAQRFIRTLLTPHTIGAPPSRAS